VVAKGLAQKAPGAGARDRAANFARGHHPKARRGTVRARTPIEYQAAFGQALSAGPRALEFPSPLQARGSGKPVSRRRWSLAGHIRIKPESGACGPRGGGWPKCLVRSCSSCG
jgi:hypothetical protein